MAEENKRKLKVAVIGCGGISRGAHLTGYSRMDNVEIVALCDIIKEKAEEQAEKYGIPAVYTDYHDVFNIPGLDAVDLCLPNVLHSKIAVEALEHGLNVFCEKPDAINVSEAERMKAAAEKSGKVLMVMRNNRYRATSTYLKKFIEDGRMGEIYAGRCGWIRRRGVPGRGGWFTTKAMSGGGPLIDLGVHMIDLAMWMMGNPHPVTVSGSTYRKFENSEVINNRKRGAREIDKNGTFDVEDLAMGMIRFDNGACLQIEFSWASNIQEDCQFMELRGTKAGCSWTAKDGLKLFGEEYGNNYDIIPDADDSKCVQMHEANLRHFADVVLNGAKPMFVPQQGVDMIKILQAMYESAACGHEIAL